MTGAVSGAGILALWNDCAEGEEAAYEDWYLSEHLPERLSIPGFLRGRRYEALTGAPRFFTYYEVEGPDILTSPAYFERLNHPTPLTTRIMGEVFLNMSRTLCEVAARHGWARGAWAVAAVGAGDSAAELYAMPGVARAEYWRAIDEGPRAATAEETLRGGDDRIEGCLFVETLRQGDAERIAARIPNARIFRLLCDLTADA
jgi:hypothetical protein